MNADREQTRALFRHGWWEDLEFQLRRSLNESPADAKTAFRLANLLAFRRQWAESLRLYDLCIVQGWPGALSLNNKAVVLTWMGEARPAIHYLREAAECAPALYNLGVMCERLAEDGDTLPQVVADVLERGGTAGADLSTEYFAGAQSAKWDRPNDLDRALLLWKDDIPAGFGFSLDQPLADLHTAHDLLENAMKLLEERKWMAAIQRLDAVASMQKSLLPQTIEPRNRAVLAICHEQRDSARQAWDRGDFDAARRHLDTLLSFRPGLPDRSVVEQILADEVSEWSERIRTSVAGSSWSALQAQTAASRLVMDSLRDLSGADSDTLRVSENRLRTACLQAWTRQIDYLRATERFDDAITLLEMDEWLWLGEQARDQWRWRVCRSATEAYCRDAEKAASEGRDQDAQHLLAQARAVALQANDPTLVERCELLLVRFGPQSPEPERTELRESLVRGDYREVLARSRRLLHDGESGPSLMALRAAAIHRLIESAAGALQNGRYDTALRDARFILDHEPESASAKDIEKRAREGALQQRLAEIANAIDAGNFQAADEMLRDGLVQHPDNGRLLELERTLIEARHLNAGGSPEYNDALKAFLRSKSERRIDDAFGSFLLLRSLAPESAATTRAWEWVSGEVIRSIQRQLDADSSPATADRLLAQLERLLDHDPALASAVALRETLLRTVRGSERERRSKSDDVLRSAEQSCNALDPMQALNHIQVLEQLDEPAHRVATQQCKENALRQIRTQLAYLHRSRTEESIARATVLIQALRIWDEQAASREHAEWQRLRHDLDSAARIDAHFSELRRLAATSEVSSDTLRAFQEVTDRLRSEEPDIGDVGQREIDQLLDNLLQRSSWWRRSRHVRSRRTAGGSDAG